MRNILLLGAGFSKNWGGPVASEVFQSLIADQEIRNNEGLRNLLLAHRANFENAIAALQKELLEVPKASPEVLHLMLRAISRLFARMNKLFARQQFYLLDAQGHLNGATRPDIFLSKYNEIFTLNQDLLLEIHYFDHPQYLQGVWGGACLPGLVAGGGQHDNAKPFSNRTWVTDGNLKVPNNVQPYYKLHGSVNWSEDGMMILGTGKADAIKGNKLLDSYQQVFARSLQQPNTRLTIIGYGFRDDHINEALKVAITQHGLKFYLIDPAGADLAYRLRNEVRPDGDNTPAWHPERTPLEDWFEQGLYSASIIPFRRLLIDESLDREWLEDFLTGK